MKTLVARQIAARFMYLRRRAMAAIGERLAPLGFGVADYLALLRLAQEEEVAQQELGQDCGLGPSGVSRMLARLVEDGLITMRIDPSDRRRRTLSITDLGSTRERELAPLVDEAARSVTGGLTAQEERELLALLNKAATTCLGASEVRSA